MIQNNDDINEARRRAARKGEEDPIVVAQRFLNIYHQIHIFSPEKKAKFDSMLLELPDNVKIVLPSLPGGAILQDYINELSEKNGLKIVSSQKVADPIMETALSQPSPTPPQPTPTPAPQPTPAEEYKPAPNVNVPRGKMELSLGGEFVEKFTGAFDGLLNRQREIQTANFNKISDELNKNQQMLAQCLTKNEAAQQQTAEAIAKALEHMQPIISHNPESGSKDNVVLQQLIEGQKEINQRLHKMETASDKSEDKYGREFMAAIIKSNTVVMKKIAALQENHTDNVPVKLAVDDLKILFKMIQQTQSRLIEGVADRILQNNLAMAQAQNNNNANNIQINTPDTSAQTALLIDKITELQVSNEKNFEKAISRLIDSQKDMYSAIDNKNNQEIVTAIIKGFQSSSETIGKLLQKVNTINVLNDSNINQTAYAPLQKQAVNTDNQNQESNFITEPQEEKVVAAEDNVVAEASPLIEPEPSLEVAPPKKKKKKKKKNKANVALEEVKDNFIEELPEQLPTEDDLYRQSPELEAEGNTENSEIGREEKIVSPTDIAAIEDKPQDDDVALVENEPLPDNDRIDLNNFATDQSQQIDNGNTFEPVDDLEPPQELTFDVSNTYNVSDWGYGSNNESTVDPEIIKDEPAEENIDNEDNYQEVEMIGSGSYIYWDNADNQEEADNKSPIIFDRTMPKIKNVPQIYDDSDDGDPYVK